MGVSQVHLGRLQRARVSLDVTGRQYQSATDYWDGNWLLVDVAIDMGGWQGRFGANLRADDFERFLEAVVRLNDDLRTTAEFTTLEGWLWLRLEGDGLGHIKVHGEATDHPGDGDTLTFRFDDMDQTDLAPLISELRGVLNQFPVIGPRPA
jgi:hypothetical protein